MSISSPWTLDCWLSRSLSGVWTSSVISFSSGLDCCASSLFCCWLTSSSWGPSSVFLSSGLLSSCCFGKISLNSSTEFLAKNLWLSINPIKLERYSYILIWLSFVDIFLRYSFFLVQILPLLASRKKCVKVKSNKSRRSDCFFNLIPSSLLIHFDWIFLLIPKKFWEPRYSYLILSKKIISSLISIFWLVIWFSNFSLWCFFFSAKESAAPLISS